VQEGSFMLTAITRGISPTIGCCELTYLERAPIDLEKAVRQHKAYEDHLRRQGIHVISLLAEPCFPDATFVEDTAVVADEVAVIAAMGAPSRRDEIHSLASVLSDHRPLRFINHSAVLEGGDVVQVGRTFYVGVSKRTNEDGVSQLREILAPYDYEVRAVPVKACLHLTTGCTYLGRGMLLANRGWVAAEHFEGCEILDVPTSEPWAANVLVTGDVVLVPEEHAETCELLSRRGFDVQTINASELLKAEAGLTCMSLIFKSHPAR
ncbi:MAG TPA: arginine deiminase family protein, partial [Pyrinomonadaceae bacterium]|nr:arginine deiminase family protein [Pyrinomonadaceae bacterium]